MDPKIRIHGGQALRGEVRISGAKNSVLKLMAAALLSDEQTIIHGVPALSDVWVMTAVLKALGRDASVEGTTLTVCPGHVTTFDAPYELVSKMRASFNVLGALLGRYGESKVPMPGGCSIGKRAIDQHEKGLKLLGATVSVAHGYVHAKADQLLGAKVVLDMPSVGATENILLASVFADGTTVISNAAQEPEIGDLANFLNAMGADIHGAGTHEITINGVERGSLRACEYTVMPDRIEAATYLCAIVGTGGEGLLRDVRPDHMDAILDKLGAMGAELSQPGPNQLYVKAPKRIEATNLMTNYYPGLPTDVQAPFTTLLSVADGVSLISETIYENRFRHVGELNRMGANIQLNGDVAAVTGVEQLSGAEVQAHDLRAGAAMVIAGLMADGYTTIHQLHHLDRGYESLEEKLAGLGATIRRFTDEASLNDMLHTAS